MKKVALLQTSMVSYTEFAALFREMMPEVSVYSIVDEDLLKTIMDNAGVVPSVVARICNYAYLAEANGADMIFSQCSSTRPAVEQARKMVDIPIVMVDDGMAERAVELGVRIGVVATAASTLVPTTSALRQAGESAGKKICSKTYLADNALQVLMESGDASKHDQMVLAHIDAAEKENEVVVLAQGSMSRLEPYLKERKVPVLTSPRLGVAYARRMLGV